MLNVNFVIGKKPIKKNASKYELYSNIIKPPF